jgi:hypothetical protein
MGHTTYQGWTNYETWVVNLWLDNDEGVHDYWLEQAQECWNEATPTSYSTREEEATELLAHAIKDHHTDTVTEGCGVFHPDYGSHSVFRDLLDAALTEVNWREIARHFIEEMVGA